MSRGKKDREEITNTEEVKETEVSDEMEKAEDSEKAEDDKKPEETKETDDKHVSLYVQEPFIDPSVYRQRRKRRIIRTVTIAVVATLLAVYIGGVLFHMHRFGANTTINGRNVVGKPYSLWRICCFRMRGNTHWISSSRTVILLSYWGMRILMLH